MSTLNSTTNLKRCSKCNEVKPLDQFENKKRSKDGKSSQCKTCIHVADALYRQQDHVKKYNAEYRERNRETLNQYYRDYHAHNRDKIRARCRKWYANNPDKVRSHTERVRPRHRITESRRRARVRRLPNTLTNEQWVYAIDYFEHKCAACGRPQGLWHTLAADHWIPLNDPRPDNPGTVATNIVPLCHGQGGCNNSKNAKDPIAWLEHEYGKRKAKKIIARIESYFEHVRGLTV